MLKKIQYFVLPLLLIATTAKAEKLELIRISSEFNPNQTASLGIESDGEGNATALYYQDSNPKAKAPFRRFPISTLSTPQLLLRAQDNYEVVKIALNGRTLSVLYRQDVRSDTWRAKRFSVECDSKMSGCTVFDLDKKRFITRAFITKHSALILGLVEKTVGIDAILTQ
jgi:hypothetical protein